MKISKLLLLFLTFFTLGFSTYIKPTPVAACTWVVTSCGSGCADNQSLYNCSADVQVTSVVASNSNPESNAKAVVVAPPDVSQAIAPAQSQPKETKKSSPKVQQTTAAPTTTNSNCDASRGWVNTSLTLQCDYGNDGSVDYSNGTVTTTGSAATGRCIELCKGIAASEPPSDWECTPGAIECVPNSTRGKSCNEFGKWGAVNTMISCGAKASTTTTTPSATSSKSCFVRSDGCKSEDPRNCEEMDSYATVEACRGSIVARGCYVTADRCASQTSANCYRYDSHTTYTDCSAKISCYKVADDCATFSHANCSSNPSFSNWDSCDAQIRNNAEEKRKADEFAASQVRQAEEQKARETAARQAATAKEAFNQQAESENRQNDDPCEATGNSSKTHLIDNILRCEDPDGCFCSDSKREVLCGNWCTNSSSGGSDLPVYWQKCSDFSGNPAECIKAGCEYISNRNACQVKTTQPAVEEESNEVQCSDYNGDLNGCFDAGCQYNSDRNLCLERSSQSTTEEQDEETPEEDSSVEDTLPDDTTNTPRDYPDAPYEQADEGIAYCTANIDNRPIMNSRIPLSVACLDPYDHTTTKYQCPPQLHQEDLECVYDDDLAQNLEDVRNLSDDYETGQTNACDLPPNGSLSPLSGSIALCNDPDGCVCNQGDSSLEISCSQRCPTVDPETVTSSGRTIETNPDNTNQSENANEAPPTSTRNVINLRSSTDSRYCSDDQGCTCKFNDQEQHVEKGHMCRATLFSQEESSNIAVRLTQRAVEAARKFVDYLRTLTVPVTPVPTEVPPVETQTEQPETTDEEQRVAVTCYLPNPSSGNCLDWTGLVLVSQATDYCHNMTNGGRFNQDEQTACITASQGGFDSYNSYTNQFNFGQVSDNATAVCQEYRPGASDPLIPTMQPGETCQYSSGCNCGDRTHFLPVSCHHTCELNQEICWNDDCTESGSDLCSQPGSLTDMDCRNMRNPVQMGVSNSN